jgi:hypothetical protein
MTKRLYKLLFLLCQIGHCQKAQHRRTLWIVLLYLDCWCSACRSVRIVILTIHYLYQNPPSPLFKVTWGQNLLPAPSVGSAGRPVRWPASQFTVARNEYADDGVLECDVTGWVPTFRRNLHHTSSRYLPSVLRTEAAGCSMASLYQTARHHIPERRNVNTYQLYIHTYRFSAPVQTGPGAHPASCTMGTGSFTGVKRLGRGVDHPPPSSAEVKERLQL